MSITMSAPRTASRTDNTRPIEAAGIDPRQHPIIARHFFGIEALRPIGQVAGEVAARVAADLKQQHQVGHLHSLGPRPVLEALKEVAAGGELDTVLADYAQLDLEVVVALGGNRFPPVPIHGVRR